MIWNVIQVVASTAKVFASKVCNFILEVVKVGAVILAILIFLILSPIIVPIYVIFFMPRPSQNAQNDYYDDSFDFNPFEYGY